MPIEKYFDVWFAAQCPSSCSPPCVVCETGMLLLARAPARINQDITARHPWLLDRSSAAGPPATRRGSRTPGGSDTSPHYDTSISPERRTPDATDEFLTVAEVAAILKLNQQRFQ